MKIQEQEILEYHEGQKPGKLEVIASKPFMT